MMSIRMKFCASIFAVWSYWLLQWSFFILVKPEGSSTVEFDLSRDVYIQTKDKEVLL